MAQGAMSGGKKVGTATCLAVLTFSHCALPLCSSTFSAVTKPSKHLPSVNGKLHPQGRQEGCGLSRAVPERVVSGAAGRVETV